MDNQVNYRKRRIIAGVAISVVLLIIIGFSLTRRVTHSGTVAVPIYLIPSGAQLKVNDQPVSGDTAHLKPGTYTIKVSSAGFADSTSQLTVNPTNKAAIDIALSPESTEARQYAQNNQDAYEKHETRAGVQANQEGESFTAANPITAKLPYESYFYTIGYKQNPSDTTGQSIILTVDAPSGFRNSAIRQIQDWGFDPADYLIEFTNGYKNPFN